MSRASRNPLVPDRHGVSPSCVALPPGPWPLMLDFLSERFTSLTREQWAARMQSGWVWDDNAMPLAANTPFQPHTRVYYWRFHPNETVWPAPVDVVFRDERLLVVDKPHFMPVTPSGPFVQRSLLVHFKRELQLPELTPIHRIDRDTAGLVVFAVQARHRAAYQSLFRDRAVTKRYEAVAPWVDLDALAREVALPAPHPASGTGLPGAPLGQWMPLSASAPSLGLGPLATAPCSQPWCYQSRLEEDQDFFTMHEAAGEANTETRIQCLARAAAPSSGSPRTAPANTGAENAPQPPTSWALYGLSPHTGRRHQLRAHLSAMGLPIRHDPYYPRITRGADDADDLARPLQLLARAIAFTDPITGEARHFQSRQRLQWPIV